MLRSDIFEYDRRTEPIEPWKPRPLSIEEWRAGYRDNLGVHRTGPNYPAVYAWRMATLREIRRSPINSATGRPFLLDGMLKYYSDPSHWVEFICHWLDTYDPRRKDMKWVPFVMFERQAEFIEFLNGCYFDEENGLAEKCRDGGLTWLAVGWSVCAWLFVPEIAVGWGSRKQELVDQKGVVDSIFEKIRICIGRLPKEFMPTRFDPRFHATFMRMINPDNGATIAGEIGDKIGRGGRKTIYFKDESAHYEHADLVEASLGDTTNVQIDISSVNGVGNVFYNKRHSREAVDWYPGLKIEPGKTRVFVMDWRDHPNKTQEWYDRRKARWTADGLFSKFAQEVDRDYSASIDGIIIALEWIMAAEDAHIKLSHWVDDKGNPVDFTLGPWGAGLDVAEAVDGDKNALVARKGIILTEAEEWGERDVGATTRRALLKLKAHRGIVCQYDSIGVGSGVKSEYNRLVLDDKIVNPADVIMVPWNAGAGVLDPHFSLDPDDDETPLNEDLFANMKAQAWWALRMRFYRTWQAVTQGIRHDPGSLIILDSNMSLIRQIEKELAQPVMTHNTRFQQIVDKKPDGQPSPNIADAIVQCYFPLDPNAGVIVTGHHGTAN